MKFQNCEQNDSNVQSYHRRSSEMKQKMIATSSNPTATESKKFHEAGQVFQKEYSTQIMLPELKLVLLHSLA